MAVSSDAIETSEEFARDEKFPFPLASDPDLTAIRAWGVAHRGKDMAVPAVFVVDRGGTVRWSRIGESITDRPDIDGILEVLRDL